MWIFLLTSYETSYDFPTNSEIDFQLKFLSEKIIIPYYWAYLSSFKMNYAIFPVVQISNISRGFTIRENYSEIHLSQTLGRFSKWKNIQKQSNVIFSLRNLSQTSKILKK